MKNILLLGILCLLVGCNNYEKIDYELERGTAIVEGKVLNFEKGSKVVSISGNSILGKIFHTAILDSLGNFRIEIELLNPQDVSLAYENGYAQLYVKPNDSLYLEFDINSLINNRYEISGSNTFTNEYIRSFYPFHGPYTFEPTLGDSVTVKEYLLELKHQLIIEDSVLNEFSKKYNPNEEFMHWAKKNNKYSIAGHLLSYYWYFDVNHNQRKPEIYDTKIFPADDDSALVTGTYLEFLNNYLNIKYYDPHIVDVFEREGESAEYNVYFDNIIANEKPCLSRDIMLYNNLLAVIESPFPGQDSVFQNYAPYMISEVLTNILNKKRAAFENREETNKTTLNLALNSNSEIIRNFWETISSKHKDKIIYLDIWATWCGPCRDEVPSAIDLHSQFENKPIAFVNLCLASKRDDWKKFLTKHHIKGDNYFFNEDETKLLVDELNIRGYPTYMIMDGNGVIINKNAPRPSSGNEIKDLLNKLLLSNKSSQRN